MQNLDLEFIKDVLSKYSKNIDLPLILLNQYGDEIYETSNFPFFCKIIRNQRNGKNLCVLCHKLEVKNNKACFNCPAGLINIQVPLSINSQRLGTLVLCSLFHEKNTDLLEKISNETGLEKEELLDEMSKLNPITKQTMNLHLSNLRTFAEILPNIALQRTTSEKSNKQLEIIHKITNLVNSTLDYTKILKQVINFVIQFNSVDLCSVTLLEGNTIKRFLRDSKEMPENYSRFENKLVAELVREKRIKQIDYITLDPKFKSDAGFNVYNALIMLPIEHLGKILGTMTVYSDKIEKLKKDKELFEIIATQFALAVTNAKQFEEIKEMAITDKLTELYNRRHFMQILKQEVARAQRFQNPLSVGMIDIDFFSHYNNTNGHPAGDKILTELSRLLKQTIRSTDTIGRYGGEEFIIIFPETKPNEVNELGKRLVRAVDEYNFHLQEKQPHNNLTISLGMFTAIDGSVSADDMIKEADKSLYEAKRQGRNRMISKMLVKKGMQPIDVS